MFVCVWVSLCVFVQRSIFVDGVSIIICKYVDFFFFLCVSYVHACPGVGMGIIKGNVLGLLA